MANPGRVPGKLGALPRDRSQYMPTLEHYLRPWEGPVASARLLGGAWNTAAPLPPVTGDIDRASEVSDWPIYLNDQIGCCTIAAAGHFFGAMRVYAGYPEPLFSDAEITTAYSAVSGYVPGDPSTDNGADPGRVLKYLHTTGMTDTAGDVHQVAGYAAIGDPQNLNLIAQVLATFGTVYLAINCPQSMEDQFGQGVPISYVPGSPSLGGHMINLQRRRVGGTGVLEPVTWGALVDMATGFLWHQVEEAFCVVSADWLAANGTTLQGLDLGQLLTDMQGVR